MCAKSILILNFLLFSFSLSDVQAIDWRGKYTNLSDKTPEELRLLKNEIYAHYGRKFQTQDLKEYFSKQAWYRLNPNYADSLISTEDLGLIANIAKVEKGNALTAAIKNNDVLALKKLLKDGADINYRGKGQLTLLMYAIAENKIEIAKYLIDAGADVDMVTVDYARGNSSAINLAVANGNMELLRGIIKKTRNIDLRAEQADFTPLTQAILGKNKEAAKVLVENGAGVNAIGAFLVSPMLAASDDVEMLKYLIDHGGNVKLTYSGEGQVEQPIFFSAILSENTDTMNVFLDSKICVDVKDGEGSTGLLAAARNNRTKSVEYLILRRANVKVQTEDGLTALMWAVYHNNPQMIQSIIKAGGDVNAKTSIGWQAITFAINSMYLDGVKLLITNGADINLKDNNGWTSLMWAIYKGDKSIIDLLLKNGATINTYDKNGWSPLALAANQGFIDFVKVFLKRGAEIKINLKDKAVVEEMFKPNEGEGYSWKTGICPIQKENARDEFQQEGNAEIDYVEMTRRAMDKAVSKETKVNYLEIIDLLRKEKKAFP